MTEQSYSRPLLLECSSEVNGAERKDKRLCIRNRPSIYLNIRHTIYPVQSCVEKLAVNLFIDVKRLQPYLPTTLTERFVLTWLPGLTRRKAASAHRCAALMTSAFLPVTGAS